MLAPRHQPLYYIEAMSLLPGRGYCEATVGLLVHELRSWRVCVSVWCQCRRVCVCACLGNASVGVCACLSDASVGVCVCVRV